MNPARSQLEKVIEILQNHTSGVICLPENPTIDAVAAATALSFGLTQLGKNVSIASTGSIQSDMVGTEHIQPELTTSGDNMVISFPYEEGSIDKVDYFIQNDKFNIVISPRAGSAPLKSGNVQFSTAGGSIEFVIVVGAASLRALGQLYTDNQEVFKQSKIINIDRSLTNTYFGVANLVNRNVSSLSELVLGLLNNIQVELDKDIATNLYIGVLDATQSFTTPSTNAGTFETSAALLKAGAIKPGSPEPTPLAEKKSFERQGAKPIKSVERAPMIGSIEGDDAVQEEDDETWLKPKIFKPGTSELG